MNYRTAAHEAIAKSFNPARALGYIPDADHKRRQKDSRLLFGASPTVPSQASLVQLEAPIMDQGQCGSCTGHGTSQAVYVSAAAGGSPLPSVPSPRFTYTRVAARDVRLSPLSRNGAAMRVGAHYAFAATLIALAFAVDMTRILSGCTPLPVVPPAPDANDAMPAPAPAPGPTPQPEPPPSPTATSCQTACDAMARVGCTVLPDCAVAMCTANSDPRFKHYNTACLTAVKSRLDVVACGADCQ